MKYSFFIRPKSHYCRSFAFLPSCFLSEKVTKPRSLPKIGEKNGFWQKFEQILPEFRIFSDFTSTFAL